jgi:hypothetical protein
MGEPTVHKLKTWARYFDAVADGRKTFEIRRNDRAFQTGDILELEKIDNDPPYGYMYNLGERFKIITIQKRITYILQGGQFGIEPGYCVLSLGDLLPQPPDREDNSK